FVFVLMSFQIAFDDLINVLLSEIKTYGIRNVYSAQLAPQLTSIPAERYGGPYDLYFDSSSLPSVRTLSTS
ncbi:hypothetical protein WICMUC_001657, partial [Wickerhamomyces mucosus]